MITFLDDACHKVASPMWDVKIKQLDLQQTVSHRCVKQT